jgi:small subunit ribosomal protein S7e
MLTPRHKIKKDEPDALEEGVAQALYELQVSSDKLKGSLREVQICSAKEVDVGAGKKAVLIFVPVPQLPTYKKMIKERSLIEELEKKFSGKQIVILAERRIVRKESRNTRQLKQQRPRSRTLTAVHEAMLEDIVFPAEIVAKRVRFRPDGSRLFKVSLHDSGKTNSDRIDAYTKVYKTLTGKDVAFESSR